MSRKPNNRDIILVRASMRATGNFFQTLFQLQLQLRVVDTQILVLVPRLPVNTVAFSHLGDLIGTSCLPLALLWSGACKYCNHAFLARCSSHSPPFRRPLLLSGSADIQGTDFTVTRANNESAGEIRRDDEGPKSRSYSCSLRSFVGLKLKDQLATGEPAGILYHQGEAPRINATILSLVRNSELPGMVQAMQDLERTWNSKFKYPWTFFNDEPFTEEFKKATQAVTNAECRYGTLPNDQEPLRMSMVGLC
jgi:hypothetical protein